MTSQIPHHLLFGLRTLTNYLIYSSDSPLELTLSEPTSVTPAIVDALTGGRVSPASFAYDAPSRIARLTLPPGVAQVVDWSNDGAGALLHPRKRVIDRHAERVSEIVARQQQAQTSQDAALRTYIARATDGAALPAARRSTLDSTSSPRIAFSSKATRPSGWS